MTSALILAAGRGTRLGADVAGKPKCLTDVAGKTILDWQLDALAANSIWHTVIVTGFEAQQVIAHVHRRRNDERCQFMFVNNDRFATTNVLTSWYAARHELVDDYVYMHGDTVFEPALLRLLLSHQHASHISLTVDTHPCGDEEMKVAMAGDRIRLVSKQMPHADAFGEFTGVMHVPQDAHGRLLSAASTLLAGPDGNKLFVEAAIQYLIERGTDFPRVIDVTGMRWREIDFPEDLLAARQLLGSTD